MVGVAQLVELLVVVQVAAGSSPVTHPIAIRWVSETPRRHQRRANSVRWRPQRRRSDSGEAATERPCLSAFRHMGTESFEVSEDDRMSYREVNMLGVARHVRCSGRRRGLLLPSATATQPTHTALLASRRPLPYEMATALYRLQVL
jgi:hypothetical protein